LFNVQNSGGFDDFIAVNAPSDYYSTDDGAINDLANTSITTVPAKYGKVCTRHSVLVLNYSTASNGTITNLLGAGGYQDERGQLLGIGGGGGGSGAAVTDFSDAEITIYNSSDPTKIIDFDASQITTGNTRTITMPDGDAKIIPTSALTSDGVNVTIEQTGIADTFRISNIDNDIKIYGVPDIVDAMYIASPGNRIIVSEGDVKIETENSSGFGVQGSGSSDYFYFIPSTANGRFRVYQDRIYHYNISTRDDTVAYLSDIWGGFEVNDSIYYNVIDDPEGDEQWALFTSTNALAADSLVDAGQGLTDPIIDFEIWLKDTIDGEIAWICPNGDKEYSIKGRPSKTIYKLQYMVEMLMRNQVELEARIEELENKPKSSKFIRNKKRR
jgi:hypothetical protein